MTMARQSLMPSKSKVCSFKVTIMLIHPCWHPGHFLHATHPVAIRGGGADIIGILESRTAWCKVCLYPGIHGRTGRDSSGQGACASRVSVLGPTNPLGTTFSRWLWQNAKALPPYRLSTHGGRGRNFSIVCVVKAPAGSAIQSNL